MLALKIILIIAAVVFAICMISVGAAVSFEDGRLTLSAYICGILLQLIPKKEGKTQKREKKQPDEKPAEKAEEDRPKKSKKKKKEKPGNEKKKIGLALDFDDITGILRKVFKGVGKFNHGWQVKRFMLHFTAAGKDPYDAAVIFGYVNAALFALAPVCGSRFRCRDVDVRTDIDFLSESIKADFALTMFIRIGSIFAMINTIIFGIAGILIRNRLRLLRLKLTDRQAYNEFRDEQIAKKERMNALIAKLKTKKKASPAGEGAEDTAEK